MKPPRYLSKTNKKPTFLQWLYSYYNEKYFDNKLPKCRVSWTSEPYADYGWLEHQPLHIKIRDDFKKKRFLQIAAATLIHEMAHIEFRDDPEENKGDADYHGPKFKKRMRRLAYKGAFDNLI